MNEYRALLAEIRRIQDKSLHATRDRLNAAILTSRWSIGHKIQESLQDGEARAVRNTNLLSRLAGDLTKRYGRGFGRRSLNDMRRLYQKFEKHKLNPELSWSHYLVLLDVADDERRLTLEKQAIEKNWSRWQLTVRVRTINHDRHFRERQIEKLARPSGHLHLYEVKQIARDGLFVDCGFSIYQQLNSIKNTGSMKVGDIVEITHSKGRIRLEKREAALSDCYLYTAQLDHVVDGDTLSVYLDCGLNIRTKQKLRLRHLDAAELDTRRGQRIKEELEKRIKRGSTIVIKTHKSDKYDRYLADILYLRNEMKPEKILKQGVFLNRELLEKELVDYATET